MPLQEYLSSMYSCSRKGVSLGQTFPAPEYLTSALTCSFMHTTLHRHGQSLARAMVSKEMTR